MKVFWHPAQMRNRENKERFDIFAAFCFLAYFFTTKRHSSVLEVEILGGGGGIAGAGFMGVSQPGDGLIDNSSTFVFQ